MVTCFGRWRITDRCPISSEQIGRLTRGSAAGRAVIDRQTIHIHDIAAELETEFPDARLRSQRTGTRTVLATPLLREGVADRGDS